MPAPRLLAAPLSAKVAALTTPPAKTVTPVKVLAPVSFSVPEPDLVSPTAPPACVMAALTSRSTSAAPSATVRFQEE